MGGGGAMLAGYVNCSQGKIAWRGKETCFCFLRAVALEFVLFEVSWLRLVYL